MTGFHNSHEAVRFEVTFSYVSSDQQTGYQRKHVSHKESVAEAIQEALIEALTNTEHTPLAGVCVYQCVFTA